MSQPLVRIIKHGDKVNSYDFEWKDEESGKTDSFRVCASNLVVAMSKAENYYGLHEKEIKIQSIRRTNERALDARLPLGERD